MGLIISIPKEQFLDPGDSARTLIREEDGAHCDGTVCGQGGSDEDGEWVQPLPHHHIVVSGEEPKAGPRFYSIE